MAGTREDKTISLNQKALDRLVKAKKKGETFSDVIIRLSEAKVTALQRRGEKEITTSDDKKLTVQIDQDKCMGAESCVMVAPTVFALDLSELGGFRRGAEPLGMREVEERTVDSETVIVAAKSCPYRAIYVKDAETGEELAGYP
jgi:ferredoxin